MKPSRRRASVRGLRPFQDRTPSGPQLKAPSRKVCDALICAAAAIYALARTHMQQVMNATAMNLVSVADWLRHRRANRPKQPDGVFAGLAAPTG